MKKTPEYLQGEEKIYTIPDDGTVIAVVSELVSNEVTSRILAGHNVYSDYDMQEQTVFDAATAHLFELIKVYPENIALMWALARRTLLGDFTDVDDPVLIKFWHEHHYPFLGHLPRTVKGQKMSLADFLSIANLLKQNKEYVDLVERHYALHDTADGAKKRAPPCE